MKFFVFVSLLLITFSGLSQSENDPTIDSLRQVVSTLQKEVNEQTLKRAELSEKLLNLMDQQNNSQQQKQQVIDSLYTANASLQQQLQQCKSTPVNNGKSSKRKKKGKSVRAPITKLNLDSVKVGYNATVALRLTVDENGDVLEVKNVKWRTTTTSSALIDAISNIIMKQLKYTKAPGTQPMRVSYSVYVKAYNDGSGKKRDKKEKEKK